MPVEPGLEERNTADDGVCATTAAAAGLRPQRRELVTERNTHRPPTYPSSVPHGSRGALSGAPLAEPSDRLGPRPFLLGPGSERPRRSRAPCCLRALLRRPRPLPLSPRNLGPPRPSSLGLPRPR